MEVKGWKIERSEHTEAIYCTWEGYLTIVYYSGRHVTGLYEQIQTPFDVIHAAKQMVYGKDGQS
jgi:hypothetical protein